MPSIARAPLFPGASSFPFPALAANAARAPLGGDREVVMACLIGARLALAMSRKGTEADEIGPAIRRSRANGARTWLASHAFSARMKKAMERLIDATMGADPAAAARQLRTVLELAGGRLNSASREELAALADALDQANRVAAGEESASLAREQATWKT